MSIYLMIITQKDLIIWRKGEEDSSLQMSVLRRKHNEFIAQGQNWLSEWWLLSLLESILSTGYKYQYNRMFFPHCSVPLLSTHMPTYVTWDTVCVFIFCNYMYKCLIAVYIFKRKLVNNVSITKWLFSFSLRHTWHSSFHYKAENWLSNWDTVKTTPFF